MFKSILAPLGGGESDEPVLDAAAALGKLFDAHIDCLHCPLDVGEAAAGPLHMPYLVGGTSTAVEVVDERVRTRAARAERHYAEFRKAHTPLEGAGLRSTLEQVKGRPLERLAFLARHHDLTIMSRPQLDDGLPPDVLSRVLLESGQPLLLMPEYCPTTLPGRVVICWKDTAASARAVTAALPLLLRARQVLLACVDEGAGFADESVDAVLGRLGHHGIAAECVRITRMARPVMDTLLRSAQGRHADLLVMGCYGHGALRRLLLGGCTQSVLAHADLPVFLAR